MTMRSSFGGHFAGHGMAYSPDEHDDYREMKVPPSKRGCTLSTDAVESKKFQKYCEEQSGEVKIYKPR